MKLLNAGNEADKINKLIKKIYLLYDKFQPISIYGRQTKTHHPLPYSLSDKQHYVYEINFKF